MHVALVTGAGPDFVTEVDAPLRAALTHRGLTVSEPRWDDPAVDWSSFALALVRTTWDYTDRREAFVAWATATSHRTRLYNPAEVLRWNTHKSYLLELEDRGAPVVPTAWLGQGDRIDLDALLTARGWDRAVCKPAVSAGAVGLVRVERDHPSTRPEATEPMTWQPGAEAPAHPPVLGVAAAQRHLDVLLSVGDVLVQPYLSAIERDGELSVVVVDGEVTHAVRKQPAAGEYRIQEEFGGRMQVVEPDAEVAALARWVVEATGAELLVSRVDLVPDDSGAWQLAELEATEPDLYLRIVPQAAERLADAIAARLAD